MSNTILTAKNTFGDGLVLDISPENTGANNLSSALNATLITANGNEMTLQNDMGNARVESAYLPDGYIPIGTCEFGDIIYIVSYNPLVNKALIGCFPSPERNISSEEISGLSLLLSSADFLVLDINGNPTGELKTMLVKKTLFDGKLLRPGDKYLIYTTDNNSEFFKHTSLYGTMGEDFPKLVKLRVASIDAEGKLTYLDSTTKWYEGKEGMESYFIAYMNKSGDNKVDIDSYRNLIDSAYSVFLNKNAGTLTLIAELETIDTFSCAYSVLKKDGVYQVFLHPSWTSANDNISIDGIRIEGNRANSALVEVLTEKGFEWHNMDLTYTYKLTRSYEPEYKGNTYNYFKNNNYNTALSELLYWDRFSENSLNSIIQTEPGIIHNVEDLEESELGILNSKADYMYSAYAQVDIPEEIKLYFSSVAPDNINLSTALLYTFCKLIVGTSVNMVYVIYKNTYYSIYRNPEVITTPLSEITTISLQKLAMTLGYKSLYYPNLQSYKDSKYYTVNNLKEIELIPNTINSDVINYKFNKEDTLSVLRIKSSSNSSIDNFIWNITVYPRMPYGYLKHLGIPLTIDFSKVGDNTIELTHWKYYNEGHLSTLTYGFNTNLSPNYKVTKVTFEFFDDKGLVATYTSNEKVSYNGIFTERFGLNGENLNYKLSARDLNGEPINRPDGLNDAGILYSNMLYGVRILVHYGTTNELGLLITKETKDFCRWYWTNNMFNDKYYLDNDFDYENIKLPISCNYSLISGIDGVKTTQVAYYNGSPDTEDVSSTLGADVSYSKGNLMLHFEIGLHNNYNTFVPLKDVSKEYEIKCLVGLGNRDILQSYSGILSENNNSVPNVELLTPEKDTTKDITAGISSKLLSLIGKTESSLHKDVWESTDSYKSSFKVDIKDSSDTSNKNYTIDGQNYEITKEIHRDLFFGLTVTAELSIEGISFDKVMYTTTKVMNGQIPVIESLWDTYAFRNQMNIQEQVIEDIIPTAFFTKVLAITTPTSKHAGIIKSIDYTSSTAYTFSEDFKNTPAGDYYTYNNKSLLSAIDYFNFLGPLILLCWCNRNIVDNGLSQERLEIDGELINKEGEQSKLPDVMSGIKLNNKYGVFFLLALYSPNNYLYLLNDIYNKTSDDSNIAGATQTLGLDKSLASYVIDTFKNIYYLTSRTIKEKSVQFDLLAYAKDLSETWQQHIVLSLSPEDKDYSNIITLFNKTKLSLLEYANLIRGFNLDALKFPKFILEDNILVIDFKFEVPKCDLLKQKYTQNLESPMAVYSKNKTVIYSYKDCSNKLLLLVNGSFEILLGDLLVDDAIVKNLGNLIKYDTNNFILANTYPRYNTYTIGNKGTECAARYYKEASKEAFFTTTHGRIL